MITGINESKTLEKYISCEYKCKLNGTKYNSGQWQNSDKCRCECKNIIYVKKNYVWNRATCTCENEKYLASFFDKIICDEIVYVK